MSAGGGDHPCAPTPTPSPSSEQRLQYDEATWVRVGRTFVRRSAIEAVRLDELNDDASLTVFTLSGTHKDVGGHAPMQALLRDIVSAYRWGS
jgi:hypothetical protein